MIIRTHVDLSKISSAKPAEEILVNKAKDEEVVVTPVSKKAVNKKKKTTPVYEVVEQEEKTIIESEIEDLKPWLEEDIDD